MKVMLALEAKGQQGVSQEIDKTQKTIDNLKKKALELTMALKEKTVAKHDTTEIEKNLKEVNKQLSEEKKLMSMLSEEARKFSEEGKKASQALDSFASTQHLQAIASTFNAMGGSLVNVGKDLVNAAAKAETLQIAMNTAFQGAKDQADAMMSWAKNFANVTPFETNEVIEATIKLKAYGVSASEIPAKLQQIGDMASGMGKGLNQAVEAYADASTGELERLKEFGITKAMIDKQMGGTLTNAQGQVKDLGQLMEGLSQIMKDRFAGGMEEQSKSFAGAVSNLRGELEGLKEELGKEIIPTIKDAVSITTSVVKQLRELSPETKTAIVAIGGLATGTTLAVGALAGLAAIGISVIASITSIVATVTASSVAVSMLTTLWTALGLVLTGVVAPAVAAVAAIAAFPVAIGLVLIAGAKFLSWTMEYKQAIIDLKNEEANTVFSNQAKAMHELKQLYPQVTSGQSAFNIAQQQGLENILLQEDGVKRLTVIAKALNADEMEAQKNKRDAQEKAKVAFEEWRKNKTDANLAEYDAQVKNVENEQAIIDLLRGEKTAIWDNVNAYNAKTTASEGKTGDTRTDTEVNDEIKHQQLLVDAQEQGYQQQIANLETFKNQFALTDEQVLIIKKETIQAQKKIDAERKKDDTASTQEAKKSLTQKTTDWNLYLKDLKIALTNGEINQKDYNNAIAEYEIEHGITEENNRALWLSIEQAYSEGQKKIRTESDRDRKKANAEAVKEEKEYKKQLAENAREYAKEELAREKEEVAQKVELRKTILAEQEALEKAAMSGKSPAEQYELEIEFMNKRIALQESLVASEAQEGELFKRRLDSGQDLNSTELKTLEIYIKDKAALQQMNNEYSGIVDKAAQAQRQEVENYKTYEQLLVQTGKITQAEADKAIGFFEQRVSNAWKNYITPIIKQATEQGYNSLNEMQKKALGSAKDFIQTNITATDNLTTGMDNVTNSTNNAADAAAKIGSNLKSSAEQADSLAGKMQTIGNITAAKGGGTPSGLGEFMTPEEAFANLPGSGKSPMGTNNRVTDADKAIQESFNQAAANANTMDNPYLVTESTPYSGLGTIQPSSNEGYDNPTNDAGARKFGSNLIKKVAMPIITKSLKDMISHTLSGMVSSVNNQTNQTSYNNSQSSNSQSTQITNYYNNTLNNQQLNQSSPIARKTNDLADMLNVRFGRQM